LNLSAGFRSTLPKATKCTCTYTCMVCTSGSSGGPGAGVGLSPGYGVAAGEGPQLVGGTRYPHFFRQKTLPLLRTLREIAAASHEPARTSSIGELARELARKCRTLLSVDGEPGPGRGAEATRMHRRKQRTDPSPTQAVLHTPARAYYLRTPRVRFAPRAGPPFSPWKYCRRRSTARATTPIRPANRFAFLRFDSDLG